MRIVNVNDLSKIECIYLAENLICVLDCKARNDDEFDTSDELVNENLKIIPVLLDVIGWHEDANIVKKITLDNINEYKDFLYDLEWKCLGYIEGVPSNSIRYDLFHANSIFEFSYPHEMIYHITP